MNTLPPNLLDTLGENLLTTEEPDHQHFIRGHDPLRDYPTDPTLDARIRLWPDEWTYSFDEVLSYYLEHRGGDCEIRQSWKAGFPLAAYRLVESSGLEWYAIGVVQDLHTILGNGPSHDDYDTQMLQWATVLQRRSTTEE